MTPSRPHRKCFLRPLLSGGHPATARPQRPQPTRAGGSKNQIPSLLRCPGLATETGTRCSSSGEVLRPSASGPTRLAGLEPSVRHGSSRDCPAPCDSTAWAGSNHAHVGAADRPHVGWDTPRPQDSPEGPEITVTRTEDSPSKPLTSELTLKAERAPSCAPPRSLGPRGNGKGEGDQAGTRPGTPLGQGLSLAEAVP